MGDYRRLTVWRAAHALALEVYRHTREWPATDQWGLGDQLRRAAISVGANIAEGCGRNGDGELRRYVNIALGSANELDFLLLFATDVGLLTPAAGARMQSETRSVCRMLSGLHTATRPAHPSNEKRPAKAGRSPNKLIADS